MLKVVPSCVSFDRVPVTTAKLSCLESARKKIHPRIRWVNGLTPLTHVRQIAMLKPRMFFFFRMENLVIWPNALWLWHPFCPALSMDAPSQHSIDTHTRLTRSCKDIKNKMLQQYQPVMFILYSDGNHSNFRPTFQFPDASSTQQPTSSSSSLWSMSSLLNSMSWSMWWSHPEWYPFFLGQMKKIKRLGQQVGLS